MAPKDRLKIEVEKIAISQLAVRPILDALQPKILEVKLPSRWRTKVISLSWDSPEVNYRLDCLHKFNEEFINQKKEKISTLVAKKLEYIEDFERFLIEDAQSRKCRGYPKSLDEGEDVFLRNTVVEAVVLRKFQDSVSVISFDGEEFPVKVSTFPGLGIGLRVGDVLRVFKPKNDTNEQVPELVCCYHIELEDAKCFLQNLMGSSTILEDFLRCQAVWKYILNELMSVTDDVQMHDVQMRMECCVIILQVCDKVNSLHSQMSAMTKQFWSSFKGSTFFNDVLPTVTNKEPFVSTMITSVCKFIENIIKVIPECAIKVCEILRRLRLQPSPDNMDFMDKCFQCLAVNVTGAKDDIDNLNWNQIPSIPASCELLATVTDWKNLPKMKVRDVEKEKEGDDLAYFRYSSEKEYLRTNFTLLREECFFNLKNGIKQYLEKDELDCTCRSVMMYRIGFVQAGSDYRNQGLSFLLDYEHPKTNVEIDPDNSRWLMDGNLLCISFDSTFRSPIWATVTNMDPKVKIELAKKK